MRAYDGTSWNNVTPAYPDDRNDSGRSMAMYGNDRTWAHDSIGRAP